MNEKGETMTDENTLEEALEWLRTLRGTKWTSTEEGGRTWDVDALSSALLTEFDRLDPRNIADETLSIACDVFRLGAEPDESYIYDYRKAVIAWASSS